MWLGMEFQGLNNDAEEKTVVKYTRAYILQIMSGSLFLNKSIRYVHLMFLPLLVDLHVADTLKVERA